MSPKWKIFYEDGSTFTDLDGGPEEAPTMGVQIIVQPNKDVGWATEFSNDYYIWEYGRWKGADIMGYFQYLTKPGWKKVLLGSWVPNEQFNEIYRKAREETEFGQKRGFLPRERKPTENM